MGSAITMTTTAVPLCYNFDFVFVLPSDTPMSRCVLQAGHRKTHQAVCNHALKNCFAHHCNDAALSDVTHQSRRQPSLRSQGHLGSSITLIQGYVSGARTWVYLK